jgi:HSP20 family protein
MNTGLMRWTPEAEMTRGRMDHIFNDMLRELWGGASEGVSSRTWAPAVDIQESADALTITAELPGLKPEEVEITVENQVLNLAGERKFERETKGETLHRVERSYGAFSRSFTLPATVAADKVVATFEHGVLTITLPKADSSKPRKVKIQ